MIIIVKLYENSFKDETDNYKDFPLRIIFDNILTHILNKILGLFQLDNKDLEIKQIYFNLLKDFINGLDKELIKKNKFIKGNIDKMIMISVKQIAYKNSDSKSFKNPFAL